MAFSRPICRSQFEVNAHQLYHISNSNIKDIFLSMKTVSYMFTSAAHQSEKPLPFVTVKDFEAIGEGIRGVSKTSIISYSPLLYTQDQLLEWSEYSANNTNWITEGRIMDTTLGSQFQENVTGEVSEGSGEHEEEEDHHGHGHMRILSTDEELIESHDEHTDEDEHHEDEETTTISPQVYRTDAQGRPIAEMGIGIFSPLWQMSPVPTDVSRINFNLASTPELASVLQSVLKGKIGVLSGIVDSHDIYGHSVIEADLPTSLLLQPVFDELLESEENTVKGTLAALLVWRDSFVNVSTSWLSSRSDIVMSLN